MKIIEGFNIMTFTYLAGFLRQLTGNYTSVTLLLLTCNLGAMAACYNLIPDNYWDDLKLSFQDTFNKDVVIKQKVEIKDKDIDSPEEIEICSKVPVEVQERKT